MALPIIFHMPPYVADLWLCNYSYNEGIFFYCFEDKHPHIWPPICKNTPAWQFKLHSPQLNNPFF